MDICETPQSLLPCVSRYEIQRFHLRTPTSWLTEVLGTCGRYVDIRDNQDTVNVFSRCENCELLGTLGQHWTNTVMMWYCNINPQPGQPWDRWVVTPVASSPSPVPALMALINYWTQNPDYSLQSTLLLWGSYIRCLRISNIISRYLPFKYQFSIILLTLPPAPRPLTGDVCFSGSTIIR